jgi:hypothetical protein
MQIPDLLEVLRSFQGNFVELIVIGAMQLPYYFERVEILESQNLVAIGEYDSEDLLVKLHYDKIKILTLEEDFIKLKIEDNELITYLEFTRH